MILQLKCPRWHKGTHCFLTVSILPLYLIERPYRIFDRLSKTFFSTHEIIGGHYLVITGEAGYKVQEILATENLYIIASSDCIFLNSQLLFYYH